MMSSKPKAFRYLCFQRSLGMAKPRRYKIDENFSRMSRRRNANYELLFRSQLVTLLPAKFRFMGEGVATDNGIT